ncbi:hypothetical protein [[Mycobacterium] vasticus]|uniref:Uncharacterized protein n=1 Tax=[Mycobacterium] vasticus TaxID=2875777 RepID=A0ABU5YY33_9MYCO|nr:hypothetical protein [Mycolicibacter sp. MYC017]MEB3070058.1 hypothetical protein [Mycolicibacter sp. MYC017]
MSNRKKPDNDLAGFALLVFVAVLWWLRWVILACLVIFGVGWLIGWVIQRWLQARDAEHARLDALRQRADLENAMVLRGDPRGFFGHYELPDPELIPRWYRH